MADFSLVRLPATAATGTVTFSRFVPTLPASIPAGAMLKTSDGSLSFSVAQDQSLSIWEPNSSTYILPAGVPSADVPVTCSSGGSAGNVLAGTITVIAASFTGIDQVTNAAPLLNGADAESGRSVLNALSKLIASRSRATIAAVLECRRKCATRSGCGGRGKRAADGSAQVGAFLVIVDDGTGYPSSALISPLQPLSTLCVHRNHVCRRRAPRGDGRSFVVPNADACGDCLRLHYQRPELRVRLFKRPPDWEGGVGCPGCSKRLSGQPQC